LGYYARAATEDRLGLVLFVGVTVVVPRVMLVVVPLVVPLITVVIAILAFFAYWRFRADDRLGANRR
jgi:hypothetical protein